MAKSIPAIVTPEVLRWARDLDKITVEEIAGKLKVDAAKIEAWEDGSKYPTLLQAKSLAKQYRVPFAYFYLPDTPQKTKRLDKVDYRTFGNLGAVEMSRELRWFLRDIEERRDAMIGFYAEEDLEATPFTLALSTNTPEEKVAEKIRELVSLTSKIQTKLRRPEKALIYCISQLEKQDFLVFQSAKIQPNEMRGLSVAYDTFPIIGLNRKDAPSARLFTLFHELVHIVTRTSGICNDMNQDTAIANQIELSCNKIAGIALVPTAELKKNKTIASIQQYGLDDIYVSSIARDFAVSREVVLHRLWDIQIISKTQYFETLRRYSEEYEAYKRRAKRDGFLPPALDKGTQVGRLYVKSVMAAYHSERITPREASNYLLGLKITHFDAIERWCY